MRIFLSMIIALFAMSNSFSQTIFSNDSVKFFEESRDFLSVVNKSDAKQFMKEFEAIWYGGKLTSKQRKRVYGTANVMMSKKLKAYPDYKAYLNSLNSFFKKDQPEGSFETWHNSVEQIASGRDKRQFSKYLATCSELFSENIVYKSSSTVWQASASNFTFEFKKSPLVKFENVNLTCHSKGDTGVIYQTSGIFDPLKNRWKGQGGKVTWARAALDPSETYAVLKGYEISLKSAGYDVDTVEFHTPYFKNPIMGKLADKVLSNRGPDKVVFPRFNSFDKRLLIENIFPNIDYNGGFTMEGGSLIGKGTPDQLARLDFNFEGKPLISTQSIVYTINKKGVSASQASARIHIDKDSIFHPGLTLKYTEENDRSKKLVSLVRGDGIGKSPFFNSFHELDMTTEAVNWSMDNDYIEFGPHINSAENTGFFESSNYFSKDRYDRLTGMGNNPLIAIKKYVAKSGSKDFKAIDFATYMVKTLRDIKPLLMNLNNMGMIVYDMDKEMVHVKKRLFRYIGARSGKVDYDNIQIVSEKPDAKNRNAVLSLLNYDLTIHGIKQITISKAQGTRVFPDEGIIVVKKNRSFTFGGMILAGRTEVLGTELSFDYEAFRLNLIETEWTRFIVKNEREDGDKYARLQSQLIGVRGYIDIDDPKNKSGIDTNKHEYPKLACTKKTNVFYDNKNIHNGAYKKDEFFFEIEPFVMDSLDNFTNSGLGFEGTFASAGIFPRFKETLRIQQDNSLGFVKEAPKDGYDMYANSSQYQNEVRLSNQGLQGSGAIDYLTSHAESSAITFLPDSLVAVSEVYENIGEEGPPSVPNVKGSNVKVVYIPDNKVLYAETINKTDLLGFYDGEAVLKGRLSVRPKGMNGNGLLTMQGKGELLAVNFKFKERHLDADTADFNLLSFDLSSMAVATENVTAHVDFDEKLGEFKSNSEQSFVKFPDNQYICYMDKFKWYMEDDDLEMQAAKKEKDGVNIDTDLDLAGPNFYSVHPKQDSLSFRVPKARFDIKKKVITCNELEYITVADARIFPDSGKVIIDKKAKMRTLENSRIVASYITKHHEIIKATTNILAKNEYKSSGYYNYVDELEQEQEIFFAKIAPDTSLQSYAKGEVKQASNFKLSPHFDYFGSVEMFAGEKELFFTGATRINHACAGITKNWMNFSGKVYPKDVAIPVGKEMIDENGKIVGAGVIMNQDSIGLYPTFLSTKRDQKHFSIISAEGVLKFNKKEQAYQISNEEKLRERSLPGNFVSMNVKDCFIEGEGQYDFGANFGLAKLSAYGNLKYSPEKSSVNMNSTIVMNFPFNENALEKMAKDINEYPDLEPVNFGEKAYEKALREMLGLENSDKVISDLNIYGEVKKFPSELIASLVLAEVNLVWDQNSTSYRSIGKIGIGNIMKKQVYKYVDGTVELIKKRTGDVLNVYLQVDESNYYFFQYKKGFMSVHSTNETFNSTVDETKTDKTKFKEKGLENYQFVLSSKTKVSAFLRSLEE